MRAIENPQTCRESDRGQVKILDARNEFSLRPMTLAWFVFLALLTFFLLLGFGVFSQLQAQPVVITAPASSNAQPTDQLAGGAVADLSLSKTQLFKDYERFEKSLFDVAEQVRRKDPERAELLYRARTQSQEQNILSEMRSISELLKAKNASGASVSPQYGPAAERQGEVVARLEGVLKILQSLDDRERVAAEIQRVQDLLKDTNRILAKQKDARAETQRKRQPERALDAQKKVNDDAQKLADRIDKQDAERNAQKEALKEGSSPDKSGSDSGAEGGQESGGSGQSSPPSGQQAGQPAPSQQSQTAGREQLEQARQEMQQAIEDLEKGAADDALSSQDDAVRKLEEMKAELEEILRQLREDERESYLTLLEARFQNMLRRQQNINKETVRVDAIPEADRVRQNYATQVEILRKEQDDNAIEAAKASHLLKEDGSSVAFPEAVEQMQENMLVIVARLARQDSGKTTQLVEQIVVETLEEMIAALRKELDQKKEEKPNEAGQGGLQGGGQNDRTLVDQIAELKMIRSLQNQINRLTQQVSEDLNGVAPQTPDQQKLIQDIRIRQGRIQQATYDLSIGRNK